VAQSGEYGNFGMKPIWNLKMQSLFCTLLFLAREFHCFLFIFKK